jgi:hypothetical protein
MPNRRQVLYWQAKQLSGRPLISWLIENQEYLAGKSFLVPASLRRALAADPRTDTFSYEEIPEIYDERSQ